MDGRLDPSRNADQTNESRANRCRSLTTRTQAKHASSSSSFSRKQTNQEDTDAEAEIAAGDGFSHQQAMPATLAVWLPQFNEWPVGIASPARSRRGEKRWSISSIEELINNVYAHAQE